MMVFICLGVAQRTYGGSSTQGDGGEANKATMKYIRNLTTTLCLILSFYTMEKQKNSLFQGGGSSHFFLLTDMYIQSLDQNI